MALQTLRITTISYLGTWELDPCKHDENNIRNTITSHSWGFQFLRINHVWSQGSNLESDTFQ